MKGFRVPFNTRSDAQCELYGKESQERKLMICSKAIKLGENDVLSVSMKAG